MDADVQSRGSQENDEPLHMLSEAASKYQPVADWKKTRKSGAGVKSRKQRAIGPGIISKDADELFVAAVAENEESRTTSTGGKRK